jgi:hypothetical protein
MKLFELLTLLKGFEVSARLLLADVSTQLDGHLVDHNALLLSEKGFFTDQSFNEALGKHGAISVPFLLDGVNGS